ncbi:MAG: chorismate synthase [Desulfobacteraceae bacterium]|nr:chorismate synthase [Desulfobacteraceae bacterium]
MSGSSFGKAFHITTFGESHGEALGVVIQGCPPGLLISEDIIYQALKKRKPGNGPASTSRKEPDKPKILSGTFNGKTTGTPLTIFIENKDANSKAYEKNAAIFRPGHGDITYQAKYGIRDFRGGGRASARETAARVAAGAVAQIILDTYKIRINTFTISLGGIHAERIDPGIGDENILLCPCKDAAQKMLKRIKEVKKKGDSLGGVVQICASNVPAGIGDPVFDKLDADIAKGLMSIGAVKAVEIGAGINASQMTGFENNDQITKKGFKTNNAGGILAGISNGDEIVARVHVKPIPSISIEQDTIDEKGKAQTVSTKGRHDISAIPRINKVCEAMMAIVLADHILRQKTLV